MSSIDSNNDTPPKYVKTDYPGLIRDTETCAVLTTDRAALMNHRMKREAYLKTKAKLDDINTVKEDIIGLKSNMADIKTLLQDLLSSKE